MVPASARGLELFQWANLILLSLLSAMPPKREGRKSPWPQPPEAAGRQKACLSLLAQCPTAKHGQNWDWIWQPGSRVCALNTGIFALVEIICICFISAVLVFKNRKGWLENYFHYILVFCIVYILLIWFSSHKWRHKFKLASCFELVQSCS